MINGKVKLNTLYHCTFRSDKQFTESVRGSLIAQRRKSVRSFQTNLVET